jgi:uncharacterized protein YcfJ
MKAAVIACATALTLVAVEANAFEAMASVVSVSPITEQVNHPTQQCWTESQQVTQALPQSRNPAGALLGGVAGGLLGALIGRGNGRVAAAAVGAGVGAITGDTVANRNNAAAVTSTVPVQRCQQVNNFETVTTGYQVIYDYDGQRFSARVPYKPGDRLPVTVSVTPR